MIALSCSIGYWSLVQTKEWEYRGINSAMGLYVKKLSGVVPVRRRSKPDWNYSVPLCAIMTRVINNMLPEAASSYHTHVR